MAEQGPPVSFRSVTLERELAARSPEGQRLGKVAKRDLSRYYSLLRLLRHDVALNVGEALVICAAMRGIVQDSRRDVHTGTGFDLNSANALLPRTADAIEFRPPRFGLTPEHQRRWGIDGVALRGKVAMWSFEQRCAVLDGVEQFWLHCNSVDDEHAAEVLIELGLVQVSDLERMILDAVTSTGWFRPHAAAEVEAASSLLRWGLLTRTEDTYFPRMRTMADLARSQKLTGRTSP